MPAQDTSDRDEEDAGKRIYEAYVEVMAAGRGLPWERLDADTREVWTQLAQRLAEQPSAARRGRS